MENLQEEFDFAGEVCLVSQYENIYVVYEQKIRDGEFVPRSEGLYCFIFIEGDSNPFFRDLDSWENFLLDYEVRLKNKFRECDRKPSWLVEDNSPIKYQFRFARKT